MMSIKKTKETKKNEGCEGMILFDDVYDKAQQILEELRNYMSKANLEGAVYYHGTFHGGKDKGLTYVSDIDGEYLIRYKDNNNDKIAKFALDSIQYITTKMGFYWKEYMVGIDPRFQFPFYVRKNGTVWQYNYDDIYDKLEENLENKIITEEEFEHITKYVVSDPSLADIEKLKLVLEPYMNLSWTYDQIISGKLHQRGMTFDFKEEIFKTSLRSSYVVEYDKGKYVSFDLAYRIFEIDELPKGSVDDPKVIGIYHDKAKYINDRFGHTTLFLYEGIFKNYVQEKYFKILKRLRSLLSQYMFFKGEDIFSITVERGREPQYFMDIRGVREEIKKLSTDEIFSCINQLKNRVDDIIILTNFKPQLEIKRLVVTLLKNGINCCHLDKKFSEDLYKELKKKYNKENIIKALNTYKKTIFNYLNQLALPYLMEIYDKTEFMYPFKLTFPVPVENRM